MIPFALHFLASLLHPLARSVPSQGEGCEAREREDSEGRLEDVPAFPERGQGHAVYLQRCSCLTCHTTVTLTTAQNSRAHRYQQATYRLSYRTRLPTDADARRSIP
jgi:hypothetical protein